MVSDNNGANTLFNTIKTIVDNYLNNHKVAATMVGVYNGTAIVINDQLPLPMSMVKGNMVNKLVSGDKVVLLRNDGGREYYILEIIGKPYRLSTED